MYLFKKILKLGLFLLICKASLSLRSMGLLAVSRILKQKCVHKLLQEGDSEKCLKVCVFIAHCVLFNLCRKMATGFTNIAGITSRTSLSKTLLYLFELSFLLLSRPLRRELKIRRAAEYFWRNLRCLEMWWNTLSSVWYIFLIETKTKE